MKEMAELETMNADIGRLRETAEHIFHRILEQKKGTNLFDTGLYYAIIDCLHFIKHRVGREYPHPFEYTNMEKEETELSREMAYISGDIWRLQRVLYVLLLEAFYKEKELQPYFYGNYNFLYFGEYVIDRKLDTERGWVHQEPEIERMMVDIYRMQETVYQLLGGVFCQGTESETIFAHYNWMKYGKRYNKGWLNDNGEPHSDDEEDEEAQEDQEDQEECEQTHYFDYSGKYIMENFPGMEGVLGKNCSIK